MLDSNLEWLQLVEVGPRTTSRLTWIYQNEIKGVKSHRLRQNNGLEKNISLTLTDSLLCHVTSPYFISEFSTNMIWWMEFVVYNVLTKIFLQRKVYSTIFIYGFFWIFFFGIFLISSSDINMFSIYVLVPSFFFYVFLYNLERIQGSLENYYVSFVFTLSVVS